MQLLTSTELLVDDLKVSYELFFNPDTYRYLFCPTTFTAAWYSLPSFWLFKQGTDWIMRGVDSDALKIQAVNLVSRFMAKNG